MVCRLGCAWALPEGFRPAFPVGQVFVGCSLLDLSRSSATAGIDPVDAGIHSELLRVFNLTTDGIYCFCQRNAGIVAAGLPVIRSILGDRQVAAWSEIKGQGLEICSLRVNFATGELNAMQALSLTEP